MTQLRTSAEWRLFSFNWLPIGRMAVALALGLALTKFSIKPQGMVLGLCVAALYAIVAYYNAHLPHKRDPVVVFALGTTAQVVLITLLMTPLTYICAAADLPMRDASLQHLDEALGLDWRAYFNFIYERPELITALAFGYKIIGLPIFGIPVVLGLTRHHGRLHEFILPFALALIATAIISALVPASGTYDLLSIAPDPSRLRPGGYLDGLRDLPQVRDGSLRELDMMKLVGIITFPSFHAAAAVLYLWALWSVWWMRPVMLIASGTMLVATPIGGGHFFVDVFAGIAVAVLAIVAARWAARTLAEPAKEPSSHAPAGQHLSVGEIAN